MSVLLSLPITYTQSYPHLHPHAKRGRRTNRLRNRILKRLTRIEKGGILATRIGSIGDCKLVNWNVEARFYVGER
jgi:hypothetical protein